MTNKDYTHLALIVDRSGSMQRIQSDMEGAIKGLLAEQNKEPGELHVDITVFDDTIHHAFTDVRVDDVKQQIIVPRGSTSLNDAIGSTITRLGERLAAMNEDDRPGTVIVAIVTDGMENSSVEFAGEAGAAAIKALIEKQKSEFDWNFRFLGTGIDSFNVAGAYGIGRAETINFAATASGVGNVTSSTSSSFSRTRSGLRGDAAGYSDADRNAAMTE